MTPNQKLSFSSPIVLTLLMALVALVLVAAAVMLVSPQQLQTRPGTVYTQTPLFPVEEEHCTCRCKSEGDTPLCPFDPGNVQYCPDPFYEFTNITEGMESICEAKNGTTKEGYYVLPDGKGGWEWHKEECQLTGCVIPSPSPKAETSTTPGGRL